MRDLQSFRYVFLVFLFSKIAFACDVCSCGSSNSGSFSGNLTGNYIGFSYNFLHFNFKENNLVSNAPIANDYINTVSITGQYFVTDNIQINAIIPYRFNTRSTSFDEVKNQGLGDVTLTGLVSLLAKESTHYLKLGMGVKLPTGTFNLQRANVNQTSATQLGTGSWDVLLPIRYGYRHEDFSISVRGTYYIKNENKDAFKFGNQTQLSTIVTRKFDIKDTYALAPILGVNYDHFLPTSRFGVEDKRTSGYMVNATVGLEADIDAFVVGASYQIPIAQNLIENEVSFNKGLGVYTYWRF